MTRLLQGKPAAEAIQKQLISRAAACRARGVSPTLAIVCVGGRADDIAYERNAVKRCEKVGVSVQTHTFAEDVAQKKFDDAFDAINLDSGIHGILLLRPLPPHLDEENVARKIDLRKDVDCMHPDNLGKVFSGTHVFAPCTAKAVMRMLRFYGIDCAGKEVVVVGRSMVIGKPAAMLFLQENATVTVCHSKTKNVRDVVKRGDIVVCAAGQANMIDRTYVSAGAVVVDVGINVGADGKLCGDADAASLMGHAGALTPVPGGVGVLTNWMLIEQLMDAAEREIV